MAGLRINAALFMLLAGVACTAPEPPGSVAAKDPPATAPAAAPAQAEPSQLPSVALRPRREWRPIPVDRRSGIAQAYAASRVENRPDGLRRSWVVLNLAQPIPLPETGGHARSAAFLADYRCDDHAWHPVETVWYARRDATAEVLRERPRRPDEIGSVQKGTLVDVFVKAICKP